MPLSVKHAGATILSGPLYYIFATQDKRLLPGRTILHRKVGLIALRNHIQSVALLVVRSKATCSTISGLVGMLLDCSDLKSAGSGRQTVRWLPYLTAMCVARSN